MSEKVKVGKKNAKKPVVLQHCLYCGKMTKGMYCKACVNEGWNEVHAMFGSTNGWDKKGGKCEGKKGGWKRNVEADRQSSRKTGELMFGVWVDFAKKRGETVTETRWRGRAVSGSNSAISRSSE